MATLLNFTEIPIIPFYLIITEIFVEKQEFRTKPVPFWLVRFSDTIKGPLRQMFFVVVLPDGRVVEPSVSKRM
jgi:hypothetical protein